jgi:hypothetical protein
MQVNRTMYTHLSIFLSLIFVMSVTVTKPLAAEDWPTYRHDISRSGVTSEEIKPPLEKQWEFSTPNPPLRAWPGPARRDGWHKVDNLKPRVIFDWAYHIVIAGDNVLFGSSSDDKVYCLDRDTGEENWTNFANGPIRFSPTIYKDKVYVGSDDGYVYCFALDSGDLVWSYKPSTDDYQVPGNGRMMSLWPIRSGVLADNDIVYFSAGIFPWENVYLCALNSSDGSEIWNHKIERIPPQGYMLASDTRLYLLTGRSTPAVFDRKEGKYLHSLGGSGGAFAVLSEDSLISGPGKTGELDMNASGSRDHLATFTGNTMIVTNDRTYLHSDTEMSAIDRVKHTTLKKEQRDLAKKQERIQKFIKKLGKDVDSDDAKRAQQDLKDTKQKLSEIAQELQQCILWKIDTKFPYSLILSGNVLYAGGTEEVAAFDANTGKQLWHTTLPGRALELAASNGSLFVSTDKGTIHCYSK